MQDYQESALTEAAAMKRNGDQVFSAVVVWAVECGVMVTDIARLTHYSRQTIHTIVNEAARKREQQ